ncbi:MAG: hypothetical protein ABEJ88_06230 [Halobacterium sp.]
MAPTLPAPWHEVESSDYVTEKYRAENPTLFVRDDHDVGVHVVPVSTSSPHDPDAYRVAALQGGPDEFDDQTGLQRFQDEAPAFELALEFATRYEDVYDDLQDETAALEETADAVI